MEANASTDISLSTLHSVPDATSLLKALSENFDLPSICSCHYFASGSADIFKIDSRDANWYARINAHGIRSQSQITTESDLVDRWKQSGCPVTAPVRNKQGDFVQSYEAPEGTRYYALYEEAKGHSLSTPNPNQLRDIGIALANLHSKADRFPLSKDLPFYDLDYCISQSLGRISAFLHNRSELREFSLPIQSVGTELKRRLSKLPLESFSWGLIHGDFIHGNLKHHESSGHTIYDFERIGYGWRAYEIASYIGHAVSHRIVRDPRKLFQQVAECFLEGYESIRPLQNSEKRSLPDLYLMRRIWMTSVACSQFANWGSSFFTASKWKKKARNWKQWEQLYANSRIFD